MKEVNLNTTSANLPKEVKQNRWTEMFGTDADSPQKFWDYLQDRFWEVRGRTVDTDDREFRTVPDKYISSLVRQSGYWEKGECKDITKSILENIEVADGLGYKPVSQLVLEQNEGKKVLLNQYNKPSMEMIKPTEIELKLWEAYWKSLLPGDKERERLMQWAAHLTFKPEVKTGIVVLIHGATQGTGKSTLGEVMAELVGVENTAKPANPTASLSGRFNSELEGKVLFCVDELYAGESFAVSNSIKSKVTEPRLSIERKGIDAYTIENYCQFFATSNHKVPVRLEKDDRRWEVYSIEYTDDDKAVRKESVEAFRQWFEDDRKHASKVIRQILKGVDLTDYNPAQKGAMFTQAKQSIIEGSVSAKNLDFEDHWHESLFDEKLIFTMGEAFSGTWSTINSSSRSSYLLKLGCKKLESSNSVKVNGIQKRNWWITPLGLSAGMDVYMDGKELTQILKATKTDIKKASFDESSGNVELETIGY